MADAQVPCGVDATTQTISTRAWRIKPSWYLLTTDDHMIPPSAQRTMPERAGAPVADLIRTAAAAVGDGQ
jgi:hypothetical protein